MNVKDSITSMSLAIEISPKQHITIADTDILKWVSPHHINVGSSTLREVHTNIYTHVFVIYIYIYLYLIIQVQLRIHAYICIYVRAYPYVYMYI